MSIAHATRGSIGLLSVRPDRHREKLPHELVRLPRVPKLELLGEDPGLVSKEMAPVDRPNVVELDKLVEGRLRVLVGLGRIDGLGTLGALSVARDETPLGAAVGALVTRGPLVPTLTGLVAMAVAPSSDGLGFWASASPSLTST
jgi:hypothetical protein